MHENVTPIRQQYLKIKKKYPGAIVFFRLGDFYETFDEDAKITSRELEIVLTSREMGKGNKVPMAGIPYHAVDNYLSKLINRGHKVAICEQLTKPGEVKGIVQRDVVRVVTPGTVLEPALLDSKTNNYLVSIVVNDDSVGISYIDITTSEFATTQMPLSRLRNEIGRLKPSEVIIGQDTGLADMISGIPVTKIDGYYFETEVARQTLFEHFEVTTLEGFGCADMPLAIGAAGAIIHYIEETQKGTLGQLTQLRTYSADNFMGLDAHTQNNLELFRGSAGTVKGSLLSVLDMTKTVMGSRLLKRWMSQPLLSLDELINRQDIIEWFVGQSMVRAQIIAALNNIADMERIINRVSGNIAGPHELNALKRTLSVIPGLKEILGDNDRESAIGRLKEEIKPQPDIIELIDKAIDEEPSANIADGNVIRSGFSGELDELRLISKNTKQYLANMERTEQEKTGIKSLRIGYNRVFGYYIEVSKSYVANVPENYIRKQTLTNGERYFTPELKEYESTILNAKERIEELEKQIFQQVCKQVSMYREQILILAEVVARVDVFSCLAEVAVRYNYKRPEMNNGDGVIIKAGRHPVVECALTDAGFIPNDTVLSCQDNRIIILTGPNMAGKSTYLKQVAIIVLMAQIGSFVPADEAEIGIVDRVFTRIGAREDLASGQSTFMVEMIETAGILNNATSRSLLILDEIGRGTSTYDGLSIAKAIVEYIHNSPRLGAKTLFATHYHEMVELADYLPRVKNYNVAVKEERGDVIFLRKIVPGGVDKSYGIHVGKMAGLPRTVVNRAQEILDEHEENSDGVSKISENKRQNYIQQIPLFNQKSPVLEELESMEIDTLTPLDALNKLYELKKRAKEG